MANIGVDLDGVVARFESGYAPLLTKRCGIEFPLDSPEFPPVWHWPNAWDVPQDAQDAAWQEIKEDPTFWLSLLPMPGAEECLSELDYLSWKGHNIYFITHRMGAQAKRSTERWLQIHGMENPTVMLVEQKHLAAVALRLDAYIDDMWENVTEVKHFTKQHGLPTRVYMARRPYNRSQFNLALDRGIIPVDSLREMLEIEFESRTSR